MVAFLFGGISQHLYTSFTEYDLPCKPRVIPTQVIRCWRDTLAPAHMKIGN